MGGIRSGFTLAEIHIVSTCVIYSSLSLSLSLISLGDRSVNHLKLPILVLNTKYWKDKLTFSDDHGYTTRVHLIVRGGRFVLSGRCPLFCSSVSCLCLSLFCFVSVSCCLFWCVPPHVRYDPEGLGWQPGSTHPRMWILNRNRHQGIRPLQSAARALYPGGVIRQTRRFQVQREHPWLPANFHHRRILSVIIGQLLQYATANAHLDDFLLRATMLN